MERETPVETSTVKISWSFSSSWSGQGTVGYSIAADHARAWATPADGSAGPGDVVTVDLMYDCEALEHVTVVWTVSAAGQHMETEWDVGCEAPPVVFAIDELEGAMGTPLAFPSASLRWSFTSPWDGHGSEEYVIESDVDLALPEPALGSAEPGEPISVQLTYQCHELGVFTVSWMLRIGEQHETMTWDVQCVAPPVAIEIDRITLERSGILPDGATGLLAWSFSSEWKDHGAEFFEIRASNPRAHAVPSRGSATPGEMVAAELTYACDAPGAQTIIWSVLIGEQHEEAELVMDCHAPAISLTIEDVEDSAALVLADAEGQMMWFFTSPWGRPGAGGLHDQYRRCTSVHRAGERLRIPRRGGGGEPDVSMRGAGRVPGQLDDPCGRCGRRGRMARTMRGGDPLRRGRRGFHGVAAGSRPGGVCAGRTHLILLRIWSWISPWRRMMSVRLSARRAAAQSPTK